MVAWVNIQILIRVERDGSRKDHGAKALAMTAADIAAQSDILVRAKAELRETRN